jgi:hypothetical protein
MTKKEIYKAGRENFFHLLRLQEENEKMKVDFASALNTLKFILERMPQIGFAFEDDAVEDAPVAKPKSDNPGIEVQ